MHEVAAALRQHETVSEAILWEALRNRRLVGRKFKRQVPIAQFVVDFYCAEEKLAVEIDGKVHDFQQEADHLRQQEIELLGIRFMRITSEQVERQLDATLQIIEESFQKQTK